LTNWKIICFGAVLINWGTAADSKASERMEQLSNILMYAQDCDEHVLYDLYTWLNCLVVKWRRSSRLESAASAAAVAAAVEKLMIKQKNMHVNFASSGNIKSHRPSERRKG
jgi:hypothetical protein